MTNNVQKFTNKTLGQLGEDLASEFLLKKGWRKVIANFKTPLGRGRQGAKLTGEIDLIMLDGQTLVFVEVKTRSNKDFTTPETAVDARKQRQIIRTSKIYRQTFNLSDVKFRFDVVTIVLDPNNVPQITHFKDFFN